MVKLIVTGLAVVFLFSCCCKKRYCEEAQLPKTAFRLKTPEYLGKKIVVDKLINGVRSPYLFVNFYTGNVIYLSPFNNFNDSEGYSRSFIIVRDLKEDTISQYTCDFERVRVNCNDCSFDVTSHETWAYENFTYKCNGRTYYLQDTVFFN